MKEKSTFDYSNGCNDNYDSNDGNFDDNDDKKQTHIISFWVKMYQLYKDFN